MITSDAQRRSARPDRGVADPRIPRRAGGSGPAAGLRAGGLRGDPRPRGARASPPRRWPPGSRTSSGSWCARCRPPRSSTGACRGIHVSARNPDDAGWVSAGPGDGLPQEVTIVQTHTQDAPFIFESLKNYFRKAGLRVFSTVHPIVTVRRQWERIVWIGGTARRGIQGGLLPLPDRAGGLQGAAASTSSTRSTPVLKCVFTAVEDFQSMLPDGARDLAPAEQPPGPGAGRRFRARLPRLAAAGQLHLPGHREVPHRPRRPGRPHPGERHRRLHRPHAAPRGLPRPRGGGRGPPLGRTRRTTASSTSTTATTPPPSTTWSRWTTS
jgi:hypothetical protein